MMGVGFSFSDFLRRAFREEIERCEAGNGSCVMEEIGGREKLLGTSSKVNFNDESD